MAANPSISTPELQVETQKSATETLFRCAGRLTSSTGAQFREQVHKAIAESKRIALDLTNVKYMDSSGLGVLVGLWVSAKRASCDLKLIGMSERVKDLLHLTSLEKVLALSRFPDPPSF